jgi:hypothetical protein
MYVNSLLLGLIFLFPITLNQQMEHPPAFLGAADETAEIYSRISSRMSRISVVASGTREVV